MLHYAKPKELAKLIPRYQPQRNDGGLWVKSDSMIRPGTMNAP